MWMDGVLHRLNPGDAVAFAAGTGIAHTFINNTDRDARLLVVGERPKPENKVYYPFHMERQRGREDLWLDHPRHPMGPHDGLPDKLWK